VLWWLRLSGLALGLSCAICATASAAPSFVADQTLSSTDAATPVLAFASSGYGVVAWLEPLAGGQSVVRVAVRPPGGAWSSPQQLGASMASKTFLGVTVDAGGDAAVTWEEDTAPSTANVAVATRPAGGTFGAVELLTDGTSTRAPAVGIDAAGQVTLLYNPAPNISTRTFAAGSPALAATPLPLSTGCSTFNPQLAVAPSGDAVAGYDCGGAVFALRTGGTWSVAPPVADSSSGTCPTDFSSTTVSNSPTAVAIDAQGEPVGVMQTHTDQHDCTLFFDNLTDDVRLVLPLAGVMTPVGGSPAATGSAFGPITPQPILSPDVGIGAGGIVLSWGALSGGFSYQPTVRFFAANGGSPSTEKPVGSTPSQGMIFPVLAAGADGHALLSWVQSTGAQTTILASARAPGGDFGAPVPVSAGTDAVDSAASVLDDAGDGAVSFRQGATPHLVHVRGFDVTPPRLSAVAIPATATTPAQAAFSASASDFWGPVALTWAFGDGSAGSGGSTTHAFAATGAFTTTVTATDAAGNAVSQSGTVRVTAAVRAPVLSRVSLSAATFRVGSRPTALSAAKARRRRPPVGTTFRFTLDEGATVRIAIERSASGRVSGRRCVKPTKRLRGHRRCTRYVKVGTLIRRAKRGADKVPFSGRIGRKALAPGRYRATLTATAGGKRGTPRRLSFRVVR
jgi:hypothetical protein